MTDTPIVTRPQPDALDCFNRAFDSIMEASAAGRQAHAWRLQEAARLTDEWTRGFIEADGEPTPDQIARVAIGYYLEIGGSVR